MIDFILDFDKVHQCAAMIFNLNTANGAAVMITLHLLEFQANGFPAHINHSTQWFLRIILNVLLLLETKATVVGSILFFGEKRRNEISLIILQYLVKRITEKRIESPEILR